MADTYSTSNRLTKQTIGGNVDSWGDEYNETMDLIDTALDGILKFTLSTTKILTNANGNPDEARNRMIWVTGGTGGTVQIPSVSKIYDVINDATGDVLVRMATGAIVTVPPKSRAIVFCDGTDCYKFNPQRAPVLIQDTGALSSGTQIDFTGFHGSRSGQYFFEFKGLSHNSGSNQNLRISASTGTASVWQNIGSFAGAALLYGGITVTMPVSGSGLGGVAVGNVFDGNGLTTQLGATGGVILPLRAATTAFHFDFGGTAAFDAGSVRLWEL